MELVKFGINQPGGGEVRRQLLRGGRGELYRLFGVHWTFGLEADLDADNDFMMALSSRAEDQVEDTTDISAAIQIQSPHIFGIIAAVNQEKSAVGFDYTILNETIPLYGIVVPWLAIVQHYQGTPSMQQAVEVYYEPFKATQREIAFQVLQSGGTERTSPE